MLELDLWSDNTRESFRVFIDPSLVVTVRENERRLTNNEWQKTAVITFRTGELFEVLDTERKVGKIIQAMKEEQHDPPPPT